jgi:RNA polymerase sigma-70 factor (ECF subfamily)
VREVLDTLPSDYRAAVVLRYWHGMSYREIAQTMKTTESAIKSRLHRARRMMARQLQAA